MLIFSQIITNTQMRILKIEMKKNFMWTTIEHELIDFKK